MNRPALAAPKPLTIVIDEAATVLRTHPETARLMTLLVGQSRRPGPRTPPPADLTPPRG
ncbi:hypothetical protein ACFV1C_31745 [Streptomyces sp. NPDC059605]|uniref:hypothetical protein n=1 Tax=unclassified Streptomyces TaxID=2593676 RepID=UPI0036871EC7